MVQHISGFHVRTKDLLRGLRAVKGAYVGNFSYSNEKMKLGQLTGNHFEVVLRNVRKEEKKTRPSQIDDDLVQVFEDRLKALETYGFINYYGLQRFGSSTIATHEIGRLLLASRFELATALLVLPR